MTGETDLRHMLSTLAVDPRPGSYCFLTNAHGLVGEAEATVREPEGLTIVVSVATARAHGFEPDFVASWLTLRVQSSLAAVGLTAAVAGALASAGIPCNVIAGYHHDHLLVPENQTEAAIVALAELAQSQ